MDHQTLKTSIHDDWIWAKDSQIKTNMMTVVSAKALMPTILVQEYKDKTITHTVHEVLTWFD